eukprot:9267401-Alexandrium_andersonii.AAC.1
MKCCPDSPATRRRSSTKASPSTAGRGSARSVVGSGPRVARAGHKAKSRPRFCARCSLRLW